MGKQYKKDKSGSNSLRDNASKPPDSIYGEYVSASGPVRADNPAEHVYDLLENIPPKPSESIYGEYVSASGPMPSYHEYHTIEEENSIKAESPSDHVYDTLEDIRENFGSSNIFSDKLYFDTLENVGAADMHDVDENLTEIPSIPVQNEKYSKVKSMLPGMESFDKDLQEAGMAHSPMASTTFYADTPEKKKPFEREFKDGKLEGLDTIGSKVPAAHGAKGDRHIFTMDNQGKFTSGDAIGENTNNYIKSFLAGKNTQERFHHSSLSSGKAVAGAGELQVRDGQVEIFSDTSGHYRPGSEQMHNVAKELEDQNAGVEKITAEFIGKAGGQKQISASALEVLGWGSGKDNPNQSNIEENIRGSHAKKDKVMEELLAKRKTIG